MERTRLTACQDLAPHGGVPVCRVRTWLSTAAFPSAVESYSSLQSTPSAISAGPSSPVWVLMYWRGTLSTSHVHTAPYSLPPQAPLRPSLPFAPGSLPPQAPFRPILPSAPYSIPPHAPSGFRLRLRRCLPSAPACPACMCACVGCQRILTGRSQVWRRGACQLAYIDARCMRSCASAPRLICCRVAGWQVVALVCAFDSANSERPRAGARANSLST